MSDFNYIIENGEVTNPYENISTPTQFYPPNHWDQNWEEFAAISWNKEEMLEYTGQKETHAVYGIMLTDLIDDGIFDWDDPSINWHDAAYSEEQYERFCKYFEERFLFREIAIMPYKVWANHFHRMMVYELMPKYRPMYAQIESGIAPLGENEYYKRRTINSAYPETLLSGNSDYISDGTDEEWERVKIADAGKSMQEYISEFVSVDEAIGDELEVLFSCMYTSYTNDL